MSFSGFSEDDIRKITKGQDAGKPKGPHNKTSLKRVTFKQNHTVNNNSKSKTLINNNAANNTSAQELPENARLSAKANGIIIEGNKSLPVVNDVSKEISLQEESIKPIIDNKPEDNHEPVKEDKKFKDLDEFEARQKLMEEQNRKRKELLSKALADRTKRTQEEAQRLGEIQEEFKKLDAMLSGDVKILRKQIEVASVDFMECQKKYNKIEKEFLEAKLLLHQKQEKKEMLTEHLCTIIEKNEERKAEKLNELLQKLQLSPTEASLDQTSGDNQDNLVTNVK